MKRPALLAVVALLVLAAAGVSVAVAKDATVGACTRKDEFAATQTKADVQVAALSAAKPEARAKLAKALAKTFANDVENLIRYREPAMVPVFVELLADKRWPVRARALYALKKTADSAVAQSVAPDVVKLLDDKEPMVRETAATTLAHLGGDAAKAALEKRGAAETDAYVKASIDAAVAAVAAPARPWAWIEAKGWKEPLVGPDGARRVEWEWVKKGQTLFNDYDAKTLEIPVAKKFVYPVVWYEDDLFAGYPRKSFAVGGNHAGEDCAWFREGCGYYAIADGLVRMVQGAGGDWGFLVLVEHRLESGDIVSSVYGHAGADILVKPGDVVRCGQRIATQGLSTSVENGGYGSHLHFGLGDGPFRRSKKLAKGDAIDLTKDGRTLTGKIVRFGYSPAERDSYGFPRVQVTVQLPDGTTADQVLPSEPTGDEIAWFQAYVAECKGWLNPQTFLPEHVKPPKAK
jgi:murein DD-endopeptidase MepM/ murein hydrolase activator NlpD